MIENNSVTHPRCLVLMAVYNGIHWLPEQLSSVLSQVKIDLTLIISVDKSSDGSELFVDKYAALDSRIQILDHGRYFGGAAANFYRLICDVQFEKYDYVALSDQDDLWMPDKLARAIWYLEHNRAQGYSSNVLAFWPNGKKRFINKAQAQVKWDYLFEAAGPGCTYVVNQKLAKDFQQCLRIHQSIIKSIWLHDWFLYAFARANHYNWIIDSNSYLYYRQHASNQVGTNVGWASFQVRVKKVLSGWAIAQTCLIAKCVGIEHETLVQQLGNGSRRAYFYLLFKAHYCRRKTTDQIVFALMCLVMIFLGGHNRNES